MHILEPKIKVYFELSMFRIQATTLSLGFETKVSVKTSKIFKYNLIIQ